ncbi:probable protein phosphatase 2C 2 [Cornus florida]|uniref:probable protein phosphatase 2C 2 n=1 Tax=Cornus florida TaxID=4283 RepID=UPI00289A882A|nr:probable protein phosphatase 2C 2 [Cornus florida]
MSSSDECGGGAITSSSQKKYNGRVRCRKWASEIRVLGTRDRLWPGSYSTCEAAAVARHIASDCLRGSSSVQRLLWSFPIVSLVIYLLQGLKKTIHSMPLTLMTSSPTPPSSSPPTPLSRLKWLSEDDQVLKNSKRQILESEEYSQGNCGVLIAKGPDHSPPEKVMGLNTLRKRPARLVVPAPYHPGDDFGEVNKKLDNKEYFEVEGRDYCLASKKGKREVMEDGYGAMLDILGDPKQAFFGVIDGHGGCAAAEYVAENLGKNIVKALEEEDELEAAIRGGYLVTDQEFLSQGVSSGACAASVLLKDGELHVANAGDCRVVLSKKGTANALTSNHRLSSREDERFRIENSGGYVHCRNGVWRVNGSLAVSRAVGDLHLKEWIISEPEIKKLPLTSDCEFLIMASDGLWDKVNDQEAVDVVLKDRNSLKSCRNLVDLSSSRGNIDDITVMVINLQKFVVNQSNSQ